MVHLFFIQFVQEHPTVFVTIAGFFIPSLMGIIAYLFKRSFDAQERVVEAFRLEMRDVALRHINDNATLAKAVAEQSIATDSKIDHMARVMLDQWERFYGEMQKQSATLLKLQAEHNAVFKSKGPLACLVENRGD
jgi:hypothetical protein